MAVDRQRLARREHRRRRVGAGRGPDRRLGARPLAAPVRGQAGGAAGRVIRGRRDLRGVRIGSDGDRRVAGRIGPLERGRGWEARRGNGPCRRLGQLVAGGAGAYAAAAAAASRARAAGASAGLGSRRWSRVQGTATSATTGSSPAASQPSSATSTGSMRSGSSAGGAGSGTDLFDRCRGHGGSRGEGAGDRWRPRRRPPHTTSTRSDRPRPATRTRGRRLPSSPSFNLAANTRSEIGVLQAATVVVRRPIPRSAARGIPRTSRPWVARRRVAGPVERRGGGALRRTCSNVWEALRTARTTPPRNIAASHSPTKIRSVAKAHERLGRAVGEGVDCAGPAPSRPPTAFRP